MKKTLLTSVVAACFAALCDAQTPDLEHAIKTISGRIERLGLKEIRVDQQGVACHTGRRSCFFRAARDGDWPVIAAPLVDPKELYRD